MSTVSSSSHEGFFSSDSSDTEEEENTSIKSVQNNKDISTSKNNNHLKDYDEDEELNKIIAKIEREHISTMYDKHLHNQKDNKTTRQQKEDYVLTSRLRGKKIMALRWLIQSEQVKNANLIVRSQLSVFLNL